MPAKLYTFTFPSTHFIDYYFLSFSPSRYSFLLLVGTGWSALSFARPAPGYALFRLNRRGRGETGVVASLSDICANDDAESPLLGELSLRPAPHRRMFISNFLLSTSIWQRAGFCFCVFRSVKREREREKDPAAAHISALCVYCSYCWSML